MKNLFLIVILVLVFFTRCIGATDALFEYDKVALDKEFAQLDELETYIEQNEGITLSQLHLESNPLVINQQFSFSSFVNLSPVGIPGFWWGCFLGPIGILVCVVSNESRGGDVNSSIIGCLVGSLIWAGSSWWYWWR
jgi:hypothetical protein